MKIKFHKYQLRVIIRALIKKTMAIFLDPGLGKTAIILRIISILIYAGVIKRVLIIAPLRPCYMVWPNEIEKWDQFKHLKFHILHKGSKNVREKKLFDENVDICLINPEGLKWLSETLIGKPLPFEMLVVDESTKFKNMSTKRFKYLRKYIPYFSYRYILTGTPTPNGLDGLQGQMAIVDSTLLGLIRNRFLNTYFYRVGDPRCDQWRIKSKYHADKIYRKIANKSIRLRGEDYLDLPKRVNNVIWVDMPKKALRHYKEVERKCFTQLMEEETITAANTVSALIKCQQIANGRVYEDIPDDLSEKEIRRWVKTSRRTFKIHDAKIEALLDLIDELDGQPLLIAYRFRHDLEAIREALGPDLYVIGDGVSMKECNRIQRLWNSSKINLLAAYPGSAALGLNLQGQGKDVCWYSIIDSLEDYDQFIKRIERQGNKHKTVVNHLIFSKNTVDRIKYDRLISKDRNQTRFLDAVMHYVDRNL